MVLGHALAVEEGSGAVIAGAGGDGTGRGLRGIGHGGEVRVRVKVRGVYQVIEGAVDGFTLTLTFNFFSASRVCS